MKGAGGLRLASVFVLGELRAVITPRGWLCDSWRRIWLQVFTCAVLVFFGFSLPAVASATEWRVLDAPRFTVVSQISERETRVWADEFNQFIEALKGVLKADDRFLPKLTVVLFAREKDFGKYRPIGENGKVQDWIVGYFSRQETWSVIGLADRLEDETMRRIIFHEGVHWFVSADQRRYPKWFNEGLAEVFSTFSLHGDKVTWGQAIDSRVAALSRQKLLPLKQLLLVSSSDKMFNESDRTGLFYSESWIFVHYLIFGKRKDDRGAGAMSDFLTAYYGGMTTEEAFQTAFGMDFEAMESALDSYLTGGKYRIYTFPVSPAVKVTAPFEPAPPALVQVALARLAYGTGRKDVAKKHAEEAVRLDPSYAAGYQMLAWARRDDDSPDGFFEAADKAVQLGAKDADALWLLAMAKFKKAKALGGIPSIEARQIANLLEKTINLFPTQKSAYLNLAAVVPQVEHPTEQDELFLGLGRKLFPDEPMILIGQAQLLRKKGNKEESLKTLQTVLEKPELLPTQQQEYLKKLRSSWDVSDTLAQVKELMPQKKFSEALALLDALLARSPMLEARGTVAQMRREAWASATLQDAGVARKGGQTEEAARLYQSILDMDHPPARARGQAEQALQKLKAGAGAVSEHSKGAE